MSMIGKIVMSTSGRDKGKYLAVIGETGEYLVLANGRQRKLDNPKHKKPKHVEILNKEVTESVKSAVQNMTVTNKMLYRAIKESLNS